MEGYTAGQLLRSSRPIPGRLSILGSTRRASIASRRTHRQGTLRKPMFLKSSTLASLRFFDVAARFLSFKRAATELHVTQGAVSQQIKHLEGALGCKLFYRLPREIKLTEEGQRFAVVVDRALREIEQEARALSAMQAATEIRLRVGPSFALRWLVPRLGEFYARHPQVKLFITAAYGYFDPAHREFDLAIEMIKGKVPTLQTEALMDEYLVPICSPEYLAKHSFLKRPTDLERCTLLHDGHAGLGDNEDAEWRYWLNEAGAANVDSTQGQFFTLANLSIEAALAHQGVAVGRASLISDWLQSGQLVMPFKQQIKSPAGYCLVYPKELASRPGMQSVIRWLQGEAKRFDPLGVLNRRAAPADR
jgi:LysR family transcriptional regulator, glycine cleavage system transcriptional activator